MIEVRNLTKAYGPNVVLQDVSFTLEPGRVYGLLGVNGAGKTTTMQLLTGYLIPTSGEVLIDGMSMAKKPEMLKKKIGYLPEVPPLYPELTVREFLHFQAEIRGIPKKEREAAYRSAVRTGRLSSVKERLIGQLSKGFRQRVALAATLMGDPEILILDEPTNGLDPIQMMEMRRMIRELGQRCVVLVSSHVLSEIMQEADELLILAAGRLVLSGTVEELLAESVQPAKTAASDKSPEEQNKASEEDVRRYLETAGLERLFLRVTKEAYRQVREEEKSLFGDELNEDLNDDLNEDLREDVNKKGRSQSKKGGSGR